MKFKILMLLWLPILVQAQSPLAKRILENWIQEEISTQDGSSIYDPELKQVFLQFNFLSKDSVRLAYKGMTETYPYLLRDSILQIQKMQFKIITVSDIELVVDELKSDHNNLAIRFYFIPKKLNDLTYTPDYYLTKSGERVYKQWLEKLEPQYISKYQPAVDFIYQNFQYPEYKSGTFVVRFVVTKNGEVKGVKMLESSNEKYDHRLIGAVYKTEGKWIPAEYMGEPVNVEVEYRYQYGQDQNNNYAMTDSLKTSETFENYADDFYNRGAYKQAEQYYSKALDYNPININARFQRAASYLFLRENDKACEDYATLVALNQKKAKNLQEKFCTK